MENVDDRLREAARVGNEVELKACLMHPKCNILSKSKDGKTALMWAAIHGHEDCLKMLLPKSDALSMDRNSWTALMWAASFKQVACVKLLLPLSAVMHTSVDNKTAGGHARFAGHHKLAELIDAYARAMSEKEGLQSCTDPGVPRQASAIRV